MQDSLQHGVLELLGPCEQGQLENLECERFCATVLWPGSMSRPALMQALVAQQIPADAETIASQSLLELQTFLAEVI